MTSVFHNVSKGTSYELLTFLIAAPVLLSIILFIAIFVFGREQVIKELEELLTGSKN
jgi:asparagine N-glycosylation enzyme membrane subunit Stt3